MHSSKDITSNYQISLRLGSKAKEKKDLRIDGGVRSASNWTREMLFLPFAVLIYGKSYLLSNIAVLRIIQV